MTVSTLPLRERGRLRQTDRRTDGPGGGLWRAQEYGFGASVAGGAGVAVTSSPALQLGPGRQALPVGVRAPLCRACSEAVSIPAPCLAAGRIASSPHLGLCGGQGWECCAEEAENCLPSAPQIPLKIKEQRS